MPCAWWRTTRRRHVPGRAPIVASSRSNDVPARCCATSRRVSSTPPKQDAPATPTGLRATPTPANLRLDVDPDPAATQWRWRDELDTAAPIKDLTAEPRTIRSAMKPTSRPRRYSAQAGDPAGRWSAWSAPLDVTPTGTPTPAQNGSARAPA